MGLNRVGRSAFAAVLLSVTLMGCGGSDDDTSSSDGGDEQSDGSGDETTTTAPEDAEPSLTLGKPDCAALEASAATLVGHPGSSVDEGESRCQFFGDSPDGNAAWRVYVTATQIRYPELDFDSAASSGFNDPTGMEEEDAPDDWTVAASRTTAEEDPDFPRTTTTRFLYLGGQDVAGLLRCEYQLTAKGDPGQAPPPAPTIDLTAFKTFCDTAKDQVVEEA